MRARRRVEFASVSAALFALTSACNANPTRIQTSSRESNLDKPEWYRRAVSESAEYLVVRCAALTPLDLVESDLETQCVDDAIRAVTAAWQPVEQSALDQCERQTGELHGCCFSMVTDHQSLQDSRQTLCNRRCASSLGRPESELGPGRCTPKIIAAPAFEDRSYSLLVRRVVRTCEGTSASESASRACDDLPSSSERDRCRIECGRETRSFETAVTLCVGDDRLAGRCTSIAAPLSRAKCESLCAARRSANTK